MREPPEKIGFSNDTLFIERSVNTAAAGGVEVRIDASVDDDGVMLSTATDTIETQSEVSRIAGYVARSWLLSKETPQGLRVGYAFVNWIDDDPTDYLAGGWWANIPPGGEIGLFEADALGRFVEGAELDITNPPVVPTAGTARYAGRSGGLFQYIERVGVAQHYQISEYDAGTQFTVDFGARLIEGCIGCNGDMHARDLHLGPLGEGLLAETPKADPAGYEIHYGLMGWRPDGTFYSEGAPAVRHTERVVVGARGYIGGHLSSRPAPSGEPRLLMGHMSATFDEQDGSLGSFDGSFDAFILPP